MCWILELHYLGKSIDNTVSTRESTSCPGCNTENSDTIHSLYSKNDLHLFLAFPLRGRGVSFNNLSCLHSFQEYSHPAVGRSAALWKPGGRGGVIISPKVCVCVCVCFRSPEFTSTWNWGSEGWKDEGAHLGVWGSNLTPCDIIYKSPKVQSHRT